MSVASIRRFASAFVFASHFRLRALPVLTQSTIQPKGPVTVSNNAGDSSSEAFRERLPYT
jgi:hypothetical protein